MSRSNGNNKKPVGFATQLTAGGIAGAMEAVSPPIHLLVVWCRVDTQRDAFSDPPSLDAYSCSSTALLSTSRHDQGPNAAFALGQGTRSTCYVIPE